MNYPSFNLNCFWIGNINGDGLDDVVVRALAANPSRKSDAGQAYVSGWY
ncbi:MAG: hypothetical protein MTP17_01585 [Candidatus Midichloria sp.]|nr:MAG: hypothetical protein MTP17_01585 [Candidatus Midichloria sp.]